MSGRLYIVDGHPIVREGITSLIASEPDLSVCGATGSAVEARRHIPELGPALVTTGLLLPDGSGLTLIRDVRAEVDVPILVMSAELESLYARRVLVAGALGYLSKRAPCSRIVEAVRQVLAGNVYLSEKMTSALLQAQITGTPLPNDSPLALLSDRELEVFRRMGEGLSRREIATRLSLSPKTVDTYQEHLKTKLDLDTNEQLRRDAALWVGKNRLRK